MFERNKVDNVRAMGMVGAEVSLADGRVLTGRMAMPLGGALADTLNGPAQFLEFETYDGIALLIAKSALLSVRLLAPPRVQSLNADRSNIDGFDPWKVLGLTRGASLEAVKSAYHQLALKYHPDRFAGTDLPSEVRDYLGGMARLANTAYSALISAHQQSAGVRAARTEPVYSSQPRG